MRETRETEANTEQANPGLRAGENSSGVGRNGNVPPEAHRFKPGQSGNPGGRPKNLLTPLLHELLSENDQKYARVVVRAWVQLACRGNQAALRTLVERMDGAVAREEA
jgi:hypothetical protein